MADRPGSSVIPFAPTPGAGGELPALALQGLVIERGGKRLLDGLTARLPRSGITAVMGPNGAGKSLALRAIMGLIPVNSGAVWMHPSVAGAVALVFQRPVLLRRSVRANLAHALKVFGVPRRERPQRLTELIRLGGLTNLADRPARALSGGEQQRVAMVRAFAAQPRLLLLDEPTASLDPQHTGAIEWLIRTAAEGGAKVILVTHDNGQAHRLADDVLFLHHGRALEHTSRSRFFDRPVSAEARAYLAGDLLL
ncbi:MAG: ATP-binding cassette domain-containing protein [Rhodospirillaceae bacterium]|nr:ATP-binding cassette domain-containing protein [Rhodospirillaceae bacterium]